MVGVSRVFRSCIDSFANDLIALAKEVAAEEIERALAAQEKEARIIAKVNARAAKVSARIERSEQKRLEKERSHSEKELARLERAEERRRQREARRLSLGFEPTEPRRSRRSAEPNGGGAEQPAPPPLFVHKRRRDGQIQALTRPEEGQEPAAIASGAT